MIVDFELVGILSVMMPSSYVSLSTTFSSSSSTDNDTRTFLSILDGLCLLSLSANVQDIADNPEVDILLGKAREIDGPYQIVAAALCHFDS
jgi:hypothetical protein